ncbi:MAG: hypothetical protein AAF386_11590, partial [Pseudomonadota bacterium]
FIAPAAGTPSGGSAGATGATLQPSLESQLASNLPEPTGSLNPMDDLAALQASVAGLEDAAQSESVEDMRNLQSDITAADDAVDSGMDANVGAPADMSAPAADAMQPTAEVLAAADILGASEPVDGFAMIQDALAMTEAATAEFMDNANLTQDLSITLDASVDTTQSDASLTSGEAEAMATLQRLADMSASMGASDADGSVTQRRDPYGSILSTLSADVA